MSFPDENHQIMAATELDRPPSPFLSSDPNSEVEDKNTAPSSNDLTTSKAKLEPQNTTINPSPPSNNTTASRPRKLCPFWYHTSHCTKSTTTCPYSHALDPTLVQTVGFAWRYNRPHACSLPLCRSNNRPPKHPFPHVETTSSSHVKVLETIPARTSLPSQIPIANVDDDDDPMITNHKRPFRHWDDPTPARKRTKFMDYDDVAQSGEVGNEDSKITCFFWYHGSCARGRDEGRCRYRHGLTEPVSMVQPPPKYVHRTICNLEWCPGDARESTLRKDSGGLVLGQDTSAEEDEKSSSATSAPPAADADAAISAATTPATTPAARMEDWFLMGFD